MTNSAFEKMQPTPCATRTGTFGTHYNAAMRKAGYA
jgi:hypothetical protein